MKLHINELFIRVYQKLKNVSLNQKKHLAANAYEHTEQVVQRANDLSRLNNLTQDEANLLGTVAKVHDIGKILGHANPQGSVELLNKYGATDETLLHFVKYHDVNLPWFIAHSKGEAPGDKAWKKMCRLVDIKLLCIFMIADRVDCPGGFLANEPIMWFLGECQKKNLINKILTE
tara:strand:- start:37661 stop:38185 length:525 start_codon:yes stop_codon:yes gene_type:complete